MKIKNFQAIFVALTAISLISSALIAVPVSYAQASPLWSKPINLSNAGSSINPVMIVDGTGIIHVIWIDQFEGYKYTQSADGVDWTLPKPMRFPFSPKTDSEPLLLADQEGAIHALWQDTKTNALYHSKVNSNYDLSSNWMSSQKVADSVIAFDAVLSPKGILHIGYVTGIVDPANNSNRVLDKNATPPGVYYRQFKGNKWSNSQSLYSSQYFRSLKPEDASIHLAVSDENELETIHLVWDDKPQKRVLWAKSVDGGIIWESAAPAPGTEENSALETPFHINVGIADSKLLFLWQSGLAGSQCTQYSQWSLNTTDQLSPPVKLLNDVTGCPQANKFLILNKDFAVVLLNIFDDLSLVAWNGSSWSRPQPQNEIDTFINPLTLDSVILGCQETAVRDGRLFIVGCDRGNGGDIWFSSRSLGSVQDWFPSASAWTAPVSVTEIDQQISELTSVADHGNNVHSFWVQTSVLNGVIGVPTIQYDRWNGESWSGPETILAQLEGTPTQLTVQVDSRERLLLAWVESETGDMYFTWASADHAGIATEWQTPQYIPSNSQANSSPDILVDSSGRIVVVYAIPINERRGIYVVESDNGGLDWTQPFQVFDAAAAGWDVVDQPNICLTGDGHLQVLFRRYSFQGEPHASLGLYYAQSGDGGVTWTEPEVVSEYPVLWSDIVSYDKSTLHRLWQEYRQSMLVSFHQISQDGGLTWSDPTILSNLDVKTSLTTQTTDKIGNIHFLQLTSAENLIALTQRTWNGSGWTSQEPFELYVQDQKVPSSIAAGISSKGHLLISLLMNNAGPSDQWKSSIISVGKTIDLPQEVQPPYQAILPAAEPVVSPTQEVSQAIQPPTQVSSVTGLNDASTFLSKDQVGLLLLGGVFILVTILFWPILRKQENRKKSSQ